VRSCIIDGELIACDANGPIASLAQAGPAIYCAFDLLQFDGRDLRGEPIEERKDELPPGS